MSRHKNQYLCCTLFSILPAIFHVVPSLPQHRLEERLLHRIHRPELGILQARHVVIDGGAEVSWPGWFFMVTGSTPGS